MYWLRPIAGIVILRTLRVKSLLVKVFTYFSTAMTSDYEFTSASGSMFLDSHTSEINNRLRSMNQSINLKVNFRVLSFELDIFSSVRLSLKPEYDRLISIINYL